MDQEYRQIRNRYFPNTFLRLREVSTPEGYPIQYKFARKEVASDSNAHAHITNLYLTLHEYSLLVTLGGLELYKRRYRYPDLEYVIGIDVFEERLVGLVLAEVEFKCDAAMQQFQPPGFCTVEVTDDSFFRGGHLATVQAEVLHQALHIRFQA